MNINWKKVLSFIASVIVIGVIIFLVRHFFFSSKKSDPPITLSYSLVDFDKKPRTLSELADLIPDPLIGACGDLNDFNERLDLVNFTPNGTSFPWTVLFEYKTIHSDGHVVNKCGGTIINQRYILTAAHCLYVEKSEKLKLDKIRLGLASDTNATNCDQTGDCAQATFVGIEEIIPHSNYDPLSKVHHNDIALIRVDQDIKYNKFVKPICLRNTTLLGGNKYLAGWAKNIAENRLVSQKHVVVLTYSSSNKCEDYFMENFKVAIDNAQICAKGEETKEFCIRDSGNALATLSHDRWYVEGIDSFGKRCGGKVSESMGIYTEVAHYFEWIKSHIRK